MAEGVSHERQYAVEVRRGSKSLTPQIVSDSRQGLEAPFIIRGSVVMSEWLQADGGAHGGLIWNNGTLAGS